MPFPAPDPIGEYEQSRYASFEDYKDAVITPEMLLRLLQGYGRGFRLETDTCVVAIIDSRALDTYRDVILDALPDCEVTSSLSRVEDFYWTMKPPEYFM